MSGDEGDLLSSDGHDPVPCVSGVCVCGGGEGVTERSSQGHRSSDETDDEEMNDFNDSEFNDVASWPSPMPPNMRIHLEVPECQQVAIYQFILLF